MKRELGIARCGLACCLCSENEVCKGCKRDGFIELSWCKDAEWCEVRRCGIVYHREGIMGDYDSFDDIEGLITFIKTRNKLLPRL